jgi:hypothetical protein
VTPILGAATIIGSIRCYNLALAEYLGLSSITPTEWAGLAKERGMPRADMPTLFRPLAAGEAPRADYSHWEAEGETVDQKLERLGRENGVLWR